MHLLTGFSLACLSLLLVVTWRDFRRSRIGLIFLLIILAAMAFVLDPLVPRHWRWLTSDLQTALPGLFWLMCELMFARRPRLKSIWAAMAIYTFVAPAIARPFVAPDEPMTVAAFFGWTLGRWLEYVIVLRGFWHILRNWRDDLVEARRRARLGVLLVVGAATIWATVTLNLGIATEWTPSIITAIAGFLSAALLFRGQSGLFEAAQPAPASTTATASEIAPDTPPYSDADAQRLNDVMAAGFYRTAPLTLARLSEATGIPEYRLRRLINQRLGYRNFNDYINHLRIAEARERLVREPETPILNISLDVGYRTLSSFNRAFREHTNMSPSQYRDSH